MTTSTRRRGSAKSATPAPVDPAIELARAEKAKRAEKKKAKAKSIVEATLPKDANKAAAAAVKPTPTHNKNGKRLATNLPCLCGCGNPTQTKKARFISGHDAKLRKAVMAGEADGATMWSRVPEITRPFFEDGETVAGLMAVQGDEGIELEDVKNGGQVA